MLKRISTPLFIAMVSSLASWATLPTTLNPRFTLATLAIPTNYGGLQVWTAGMDFLSDGRMVLGVTDFMGGGEVPTATRAGSRVLIVSGTQAGGTIAVSEVANMFLQPAGLVVANNDRIYLSDRDGFYQILNPNIAGGAGNRRKIHSYYWPGAIWANGTSWHQWVFSVMQYQGKFYAPYSGTIQPGGPSDLGATSPMAGAFLQFDTNTLDLTSRYAGGLRSPNGGNVSPSGEFMVCDNQGSWLPTSTLNRIRPGMFYGHRQSVGTKNFAEALPYDPPVAWLNHDIAQRRSPTQPLYLPSGPYQGDWILGDINAPGLMRVAIDSVLVGANWELNGYLSHFSQGFPGGLGNGAAAINRLKIGPDGAIYVATFRSVAGNWSGDPTQGIYRMTYKAPGVSFEVKHVRSLVDGYEIEFSDPINPATAVAANFMLEQRNYVRQSGYGQGVSGYTARTITQVQVSTDNRRVHLVVTGLIPYQAATLTHWISHILVRPALTSAIGDIVYNDEAWHTLNHISTRVWNPAVVSVAPRFTSLGDKVWHGISGNRLRVNIELAGSYRATLRDLSGRLLSEHIGSGVGQVDFTAPQSNQAVYLLEVRSGNGQYSKTVSF